MKECTCKIMRGVSVNSGNVSLWVSYIYIVHGGMELVRVIESEFA